jgi:type III pantothenate kinase
VVCHRWLLIGNSRWHWAELATAGLRLWHEAPDAGVASARAAPPWAWAAVGPVPTAAGLDGAGQLRLSDVPLRDLPPWLGLDRALGGWQAWQEQPDRPVLVADAGTVLSLTRVDRRGGFRGGRLLAGLALQLRAMAAGTQALPALDAGCAGPGPAPQSPLREPWPHATEAAMLEGVARGLVAAIAAAACEAQQAEAGCRLVLTGGDAALLLPLLEKAGNGSMALSWRPGLCLEALAALRPPAAAAGATLAPAPALRPDQDR